MDINIDFVANVGIEAASVYINERSWLFEL